MEPTLNAGEVQSVNIEQQMREAYLDYAMSVIVSRALPDARDGLKPVHRRILYAMHDMGLRPDTPFKKSARIVGEVLGKYHPHGDASVYDAMVRLAQDFSMRYMLVDGQGNFGSVDGDGAAAMRYTEVRMESLGNELLTDIEKETVNFVENFDGSLSEPAVLPSNIPNLLVNGASGIAVGMSTNIPPHNLGEVVNALLYLLKNWDRVEDISIEDLMQYIQGPDFPTGGVVYSHRENDDVENPVTQAYATGRGKIILRARVHAEDMGRGKSRIIVSELPYQTNKTTLIERIASLVQSGRLEGISDLRDESDRQNQVRLVIELQRGADVTSVLAELFKLTPLQETFSIIMLALVDNQPRLLTLKQALRVYIQHRIEIVRRRSEYDLARARERAHILEGLLVALDNLDEVIRIIRKSRNTESARNNLVAALSISEIQAQAILDMQLRRLASLETRKIKDEYAEKKTIIKNLEALLKSEAKIRDVIGEELVGIRDRYNDPRRTIIAASAASSVSAADFLAPEELTWVSLTTNNRISRTYDDTPPKVTTTVKYPPRVLHESSTSQAIYVVTRHGQCATIPVQQIPQSAELGDGALFSDLSPLNASDEPALVISLPMNSQNGYLTLITAQGQIKRSRLGDLPGVVSKPFTVMNVSSDDRIVAGFVTDGKQDVMMATSFGQTIRFDEDDVRPTGLASGGVRGIKLVNDTDSVVSAFPVPDSGYIWSITDDGIAKISDVEEYPSQGRAGSGVINMRLPRSSKGVAAVTAGRNDDTIIVLTSRDKPKYMRISLAPAVKRGRDGGEQIIALRDGETVTALATYDQMNHATEGDPVDEAVS